MSFFDYVMTAGVFFLAFLLLMILAIHTAKEGRE